ncbi:hypothetical protein Dip510_001190 [Elusimicrobium posterum]|uniref:outer membrane beta-barrel protein n=1 Tax=Elusimicrobium posterum TaxID=3116653 RepID=UPI003C7320B8
MADSKIDAKTRADQQTTKAALKKQESSAKKYMSIEVGAMDNSLKMGDVEIGGASVALNAKYYWRLFKSNLWLGPTATVSTVPKKSFKTATEESEVDGQLFHIGLGANYYFTPNSPFQTYATAMVGYESISIDVKSEDIATQTALPSSSASSSGFVAAAGLGIERRFGDTAVGLEGKVYNASRGSDLSESDSMFYSAMLKVSWKF